MSEHYYILEDDGFRAMEVRMTKPRIGHTIKSYNREWEVWYIEGKVGKDEPITARCELKQSSPANHLNQ